MFVYRIADISNNLVIHFECNMSGITAHLVFLQCLSISSKAFLVKTYVEKHIYLPTFFIYILHCTMKLFCSRWKINIKGTVKTYFQVVLKSLFLLKLLVDSFWKNSENFACSRIFKAFFSKRYYLANTIIPKFWTSLCIWLYFLNIHTHYLCWNKCLQEVHAIAIIFMHFAFSYT